MARASYRMLDGKLVTTAEWYRAQPRKPRSSLACPAIRSDGMDATMNHADGRLYDSRSAYDAALRATGHHIVESGEFSGRAQQGDSLSDEPIEQSIKTAMEQLEGRT